MKANKQIKDIKIALDKIEKEKEMPQLIKEFKTVFKILKRLSMTMRDEKTGL